MFSRIIPVLLYVGLCAATYYTPTNVCPTKVNVVYEEMPMTVTQIHVEDDGPYFAVDIYVSKIITSSVVTATKVILSTETITLPPVTHTHVKLHETKVPVTITHVKTVTKVLTNTETDIVTSTATNYATVYTTKYQFHSVYDESVSTSTWTATVTHTSTKVVSSVYEITETPVITKEVTSRVPHTKLVYATVGKHAEEKTHTATETITKTICSKRTYY